MDLLSSVTDVLYRRPIGIFEFNCLFFKHFWKPWWNIFFASLWLCTQRFYLLIAISHPQSRKELNFSFYSVWSPLVFTLSLHTLRFFSGQKRPTTNWNFLFSPINHHGKKNCFTQQFSWDWFIYISLNFQGIKEKWY